MNITATTQLTRNRAAFTLVELLLVVAIIAILASLGVGVMAQAQNDASVAATRSRISIIEKILEIELEDYEVRRSPVSLATLSLMAQQLDSDSDRFLLHVKLLKRMIMADLIRAEMPDGSISGGTNIGEFPTFALRDFFQRDLNIDVTAFTEMQQGNKPATVAEWETWAANYLGGTVPTPANWPPIRDSNPRDIIIEDAVLKSELLYAMLSRIDVDGVPATDTLGPQAIADTNNNGFNEIVDGWGEPLFLQWQQEVMTGDPEEGLWDVSNTEVMCGLSCEHELADSGVGVKDYVFPVLPTQIRPFMTSEKLLAIDGYPTDSTRRALQ